MLQDIRFSKKIQRLQDAMREAVLRMCQIQWAITHNQYLAPNALQIQLGTISDQAERSREEILLRKAQILEILGNLSVTLGFNRRVWTDYLFDEVFPLPGELREKLMTPDPIDLENVEKELELQKNVHKKPIKPPQRATADNIRQGFRSFGYGGASSSVREQDAVKIARDLVEGVMTKEDVTDLLNTTEKIKESDTTKMDWTTLRELGIVPGALAEGAHYNDPSGDFKPRDL